ncbi:hypothetical protein ASPZODRAFT_136220 [Penicilliopsis zonata CBS 506.65]|uniref:ZZ-type domain-containing protein n=1 Tax=Penicilliopsis zonata CBS 506.65 TaxID=1073090 RepID=A0A1L9S891_9EURO|nr:hypothetical protein ASPZODRAFT_136220 [Penicilliopsis zonata CBS 506.65]OJJ43374.1 hypothetical protein ASPZODRAFT_136220 [Penicilliopsis zonata CBS 506.65]
MASYSPKTTPVGPDTIITIKVLYNDSTRRFKLPLRDLGARVFPEKLRQLLGIPADENVILERYSDSAASYIQLDSENLAVYKQLYRAAKAKLKLRIKVVDVVASEPTEAAAPSPVLESAGEQTDSPRPSYLDTVLSAPLPTVETEEASTPSAGMVPEVVMDVGAASLTGETAQWTVEDSASTPSRYRDFVYSQNDLGCQVPSHSSSAGVFCIECNNCGRSIPNEHYHCSKCEDGDYDLCLQCVEAGIYCQGPDHWLIKRFVKDGTITNSVTETVPPRKVSANEEAVKPTDPPLPEEAPEKTPETPSDTSASTANAEARICNTCLKEFEEAKMVTCSDCEDYDLCMTCLLRDAHGHHPAHTFTLLRDRKFCLKSLVKSRCAPGRHHQHAAICDGCDKRIIGVRHKCLACPDWDYCAECVLTASESHPLHRFVPIYDAIAEPAHHHEVHYGVFCDGPLCKSKPSAGYITGVRYKCAVCNDTDFCASCEALPTNTHNRTHPLIKFKTPVRNVTVDTLDVNPRNGAAMNLGDRVQKSASTQASAPIELVGHSATIVEKQVEEEVKEEEEEEEETPQPEEQLELAVEPTPAVEETKSAVSLPPRDTDYQAFYIRDTVEDGTKMPPDHVFEQTWTLYNPGPLSWPAGSDVRFVGGDSMFNVDTNHPSSVDSINAAMQSNKLPGAIAPGMSADFTVTLRTPSRQGAAISYWRMKLPNGTPFGHRLWCDVQVREEEEEDTTAPEAKPEEASSNADESSEQSGSTMIFPTLDKESPVTSTHEAMTAAPPAPSLSNASERDVLEDVESLTLEDDDTDAGFLTDEEYDILDASDHEFLDARQAQ